PLDRSFDAGKLTAGLASCEKPVVFDLDGVTRITSSGVRAWMRALGALTVERYYFVRCRPALVLEFSMVPGFAQRGELVSLYCPFRCRDCGRSVDVPLDLRREHHCLVSARPPQGICPDCRVAAEFDEDPASYFAFGRNLPAPTVLPRVNRVLDTLLEVT